ncbi:MAG: undecaprenyl/decaprenyl-phosphate alpha-N-acetylglucosaminyl 1-phosphate transferase [Anaerolineae bacterium]|jgi:UDP-GlcNAc:undecaprenyl-phosphate GlcNAc-1-phosphate transferase|nr:undecaprenyl/decaprenyl-phosphate alpha-N-acetylglucosaminyl 1-phosphate transferase [Anaerolineae bacterium]
MTDHLQYVPVLVVGFFVALGLTPISRQLAMRLGVVAKPNNRTIHSGHMPLLGGLAIYIGFTLSLLIFSPPAYIAQFGAILAGAGFIAAIGALDDRYNLTIRTRFLAAAAAGAFVVLSGVRFELTGVALIDGGLTVFWIMALTNAVNFQDNMDGLSAGSSAIAALFFLLIALSQGQILVSLLAAAVLGSALGFLVYNFAPSSTFMGDMGALMLGFVLSVIAVKVEMIAPPFGAHWLVPLLVVWLPAFDINLVIWTRIGEGRSPGQAGRDHTSHRLMSLGLSHRRVLLILYATCTLFGLAGLTLVIAPSWGLALACVGLIAAQYGLMWRIRRLRQWPTKP